MVAKAKAGLNEDPPISAECARLIMLDQDKAIMDALFRLSEDQQEVVDRMRELEEEVAYWKEQATYWMERVLGRKPNGRG